MKGLRISLVAFVAAMAPLGAGAEEASLQFALAKIFAQEGSYQKSVQAFSEAAKLAPEDPYVRIEYARFLARLGQGQSSGIARRRYLSRAAQQIEEARRLAPGNLDVLRTAGDIYLSLADGSSEALDRALGALEEIRGREPFNLEAMVALGQIYLQMEEPEKAAEVFAEGVSHTPTNRTLQYLLADAWTRAGRHRKAEEALQEILRVDPEAQDARFELSDLQSRRGDHGSALATLEASPETGTEDPELRRRLAWEYFRNGRLDRALEQADAILAEEPENNSLRYLKGRILSLEGDALGALEVLRSLYRESPENTDLAIELAGLMSRSGAGREAVELLSRLIVSHPAAGGGADDEALGRLHLGLASIYTQESRWQDVVAALEVLLDWPEEGLRTAGVVFTAEALHELERDDEALRLLASKADDGLEVHAKQIELLVRLGEKRKALKMLRPLVDRDEPRFALEGIQAFHAHQLYAATLETLERLVERFPDSLDSHFLLGAARERSDQPELAASAFQKLLERDPAHAPALNYLGYMWADRGENLIRALELIKGAVEIDPDNGAYVDSLGWTHFKLGNFDRARNHLERAVELIDGDAVVFEHLGDVYSALGNDHKAVESYLRALDLATEDAEELRLKLERLRNR